MNIITKTTMIIPFISLFFTGVIQAQEVPTISEDDPGFTYDGSCEPRTAGFTSFVLPKYSIVPTYTGSASTFPFTFEAVVSTPSERMLVIDIVLVIHASTATLAQKLGASNADLYIADEGDAFQHIAHLNYSGWVQGSDVTFIFTRNLVFGKTTPTDRMRIKITPTESLSGLDGLVAQAYYGVIESFLTGDPACHVNAMRWSIIAQPLFP